MLQQETLARLGMHALGPGHVACHGVEWHCSHGALGHLLLCLAVTQCAVLDLWRVIQKAAAARQQANSMLRTMLLWFCEASPFTVVSD